MGAVRLEQQGDRSYLLSGELTFATVPGVWKDTERLFANSEPLTIDLAGITRSDSAALALFLAWFRQGKDKVRYRHLPAQLLAVARLSGIDDWLSRACDPYYGVAMGIEEPSQEEIVLRTVKRILTEVIRETAVAPGMLHPLTTATREEIRRCFVVITEREQALAAIAGRPFAQRPHFKDDPRTRSEVVVPITSLKRTHLDQHDRPEHSEHPDHHVQKD